VAERIARLTPYVPAGAPEMRVWRLHRLLLRGAEGTTARITLEDADGRVHEVSLARRKWSSPPPERQGEAVRIENGNVGYIDLNRLGKNEVDAAFARVATTRALILDQRGYPNQTLWGVAARINVRGAQAGAWFRTRRVGPKSEWESDPSMTHRQPIAATDQPPYPGKVFVLIDARTGSQGEHACLFFSAAAPVTFVGEPSAGIDGGITTVTLPGRLSVIFTGNEIRGADGRSIAGVGITPDVLVRPTLSGLRGGRDEILERALQLAAK
jgi:C-terminal processing protease CtpA/Prc